MMFAIRTILFATDLAPCSQLAFDLATRLARAENALLIVLHVAHRPVVIYDEDGSLLPDLDRYAEIAAERLARLRPSDPGMRVEHLLREGEVAAEILRAARENAVDLIVLGTEGRRGLGRWLMGSVATDVMHAAPCAVLIAWPSQAGGGALASPSSRQGEPASEPGNH